MNRRIPLVAAALLGAVALPACDSGNAQDRAVATAGSGVAMTVYASPT